MRPCTILSLHYISFVTAVNIYLLSISRCHARERKTLRCSNSEIDTKEIAEVEVGALTGDVLAIDDTESATVSDIESDTESATVSDTESDTESAVSEAVSEVASESGSTRTHTRTHTHSSTRSYTHSAAEAAETNDVCDTIGIGPDYICPPLTARLHTDGYDNVYVLLQGRKKFRVYSPVQTLRMQTVYPTITVTPNGYSHRFTDGKVYQCQYSIRNIELVQ